MKTSTRNIDWNQVYSLVALNAAVVISWIAYHNYQPKVLTLFHFEELSFFLVAAQAIILVCIPPLAGWVGDRVIQSGGNRFIVFTVGTSVTAMVFMCVAFTVGTAQTIDLTAALPVMIVVWLISMNIFHSPANSMLELFAPAKELPLAMGLMTMTTEILYALEPVVVWFVDLIGPVSTFALGGVLLIVTGIYFRSTTRNVSLQREVSETTAKSNNYALVLTLGLLLGLITAIIMNVLPDVLAVRFENFSHSVLGGSHFASFILGLSALLAWPLSMQAHRYDLKVSLTVGFAMALLSIAAILFIPNAVVCVGACATLAFSFSLLNILCFPMVLGALSPASVTFGAGLYFGSLELADGLINIMGKL